MRLKCLGKRILRRSLMMVAAGILPAFIMRCDKAALNFQRGFFEGLGFNVSALLVENGLLGPTEASQ